MSQPKKTRKRSAIESKRHKKYLYRQRYGDKLPLFLRQLQERVKLVKEILAEDECKQFACGHDAFGYNAMTYNAGRKNKIDVRCRECYNALRLAYQRKRKAERTGELVREGPSTRPASKSRKSKPKMTEWGLELTR
jgi:ABC-type Zn2+ transport system substrate-binding protein/surface adhesin